MRTWASTRVMRRSRQGRSGSAVADVARQTDCEQVSSLIFWSYLTRRESEDLRTLRVAVDLASDS